MDVVVIGNVAVWNHAWQTWCCMWMDDKQIQLVVLWVFFLTFHSSGGLSNHSVWTLCKSDTQLYSQLGCTYTQMHWVYKYWITVRIPSESLQPRWMKSPVQYTTCSHIKIMTSCQSSKAPLTSVYARNRKMRFDKTGKNKLYFSPCHLPHHTLLYHCISIGLLYVRINYACSTNNKAQPGI